DAGISRQLQHPGSLADDEIRYLHDHPVRKFERIMMLGWPVHVDLSEARKVVADIPAEYRSFHPYVRLEGDLGPRAEADRDCSIVGGRKSTRMRPQELCRHQSFRSFRRSRGYGMQAIVTHDTLPIVLNTEAQTTHVQSCSCAGA